MEKLDAVDDVIRLLGIKNEAVGKTRLLEAGTQVQEIITALLKAEKKVKMILALAIASLIGSIGILGVTIVTILKLIQ